MIRRQVSEWEYVGRSGVRRKGEVSMLHKTIAATALTVALLAGSAYAGSRWIITSTRQIKPSVLRHLRGQRGPQGLPGTQGPQGSQGPQGLAGADGSARAVALVNPDGTLWQGAGFPKNVTGVIHSPNSGIYCVKITPGIETADAVVSLTNNGNATGVYTVPNAPVCPVNGVEVLTFIETEPATTSSGTPLDTALKDGGFVVLVP
jgi:hypothetical protein